MKSICDMFQRRSLQSSQRLAAMTMYRSVPPPEHTQSHKVSVRAEHSGEDRESETDYTKPDNVAIEQWKVQDTETYIICLNYNHYVISN